MWVLVESGLSRTWVHIPGLGCRPAGSAAEYGYDAWAADSVLVRAATPPKSAELTSTLVEVIAFAFGKEST